MTPTSDTSARSRPTRAQQRDATKSALLDATIASLVEVGYAATSARGIAERAGVSQGAQQHHFPTKTALINAAVASLAEQVPSMVFGAPSMAETDRDAAAMLIEMLWLLHNLPLVVALMEFVSAARTEPEVAGGVIDLLERIDTIAMSIATAVVPELAQKSGAKAWLWTTMATMRGAVMVASIPGAERVTLDWPDIRENIMRSLDALIAEA